MLHELEHRLHEESLERRGDGGDEEQGSESDPHQPLTHNATLHHHCSTYSLLVFALPLSRSNVGHYWTLPVFVALILFVFTLTCQVGLTFIAGAYIRGASASFKLSLIGSDDMAHQVVVAMTPIDYAAEEASHYLTDRPSWLDIIPQTKEDEDVCCNGAECAAMQIRCCDRTSVSIGRPNNSSGHSMLLVEPKTVIEHSEAQHFGRSREQMCFQHDGVLDCTAPSFLFVNAWEDLDSNGDGVWTIEEARQDKANLGCRFGVSVAEMFRSACEGIVKDAQDTAANSYSLPIVPEGIEKLKAIPRGYFDWWKAIVVLCVTPDTARCSSLVANGIFDGAIGMARRTEVTRGGIANLDTAVDFCQRMLAKSGICEKTLPASYLMYRSRVMEKCGTPSYSSAGKYHNPHDSRDVTRVTSVDYAMYDSYAGSAQADFSLFLFLILVVWYVSLLNELKHILQLADFTCNFTVNGQSPMLTPAMEAWVRLHMTGNWAFVGNMLLPTASSEEKGDVRNSARRNSGTKAQGTFGAAWRSIEHVMVIESHARSHNYICLFMVLSRLLLLIYLADVGTAFITNIRDHSELLMNAVALAFILQLPEFLYILLVPEPVKDRLQDACSRPFPSFLPGSSFHRFFFTRTAWGLIGVPICAATVVYYNFVFNISPFLEALQCACYQKGDSCNAAPMFEQSWWDAYWSSMEKLTLHRSSWMHS